MLPLNRFWSWAIVVGLTLTLSGCGTRPSDEKHKSAGPTKNSAQEGPAGQYETSSQAGQESESANGLDELSDADTALAKKQRICPVSGDVLGEMGKPYKVTIQGKTVFLCCSGCEKEIRKNPEKYLAKIEKGMVDGRKSPSTQGK